MKILSAIKTRLKGSTEVAALATGGIYLTVVSQSSNRPSILLELVESGQDYSHQGPVGLIDAHVRVTARADTDEAAARLGDAVSGVLRNFVGVEEGCVVQLCAQFNSASGYEPQAKVFTYLTEYTVHYSRRP